MSLVKQDSMSKSLVKQSSFVSDTGEDDEHESIMRNEYHEQLSAQIAALAVDIPHVSILEGIQTTIKYRRVIGRQKQSGIRNV